MHDSFAIYMLRTIQNTTQGVVNIAMFLPYYFSVIQLTKTLFAPWKNTISRESSTSWDIEILFRRFADNFASRFVGYLVRSSILIAYILIQVFFVLAIPLIYVVIIATAPLSYLFYALLPSEKERKDAAYNAFMRRHLADQKYQDKVIEWFEIYYQNSIKKPWWSLEQLLTQPPLGRDLTYGYTNKLDQFSTELTLQKPHHKHLIGRQKEIEIIQRILAKSSRANVLLTGEEDVGKHAIIEALAKSIYEGSANQNLGFKRILEIDIDKILAQTVDFAKREETLSLLFDEAARAKNTIIVIKDLERYVDNEDGHIDMSSVIVKYASTNTIQFIATTTPYMFQKHIFPRKELVSIFEQVPIAEVTPQQGLRILLDSVPDIERRHGVNIVYGALVEAIDLSERYITDQPLPEKAIELLDEAAIYTKATGAGNAVDPHMIHVIMEQRTHVPTEITDTLKQKLLHLEEKLKERVIYQDQAIEALGVSLRKAFVHLVKRRKPLASMLFLGPTGVGKTETAKALTEVFFESPDALIRFDMSNFQSPQDIGKLIGSPEMNEPGQLTEAIRNRSYGTLLLDELEKAHTDLLNIFLTILDEGYFTDGYGKRVDCSSLIIIATSNAGANFIFQHITEGLSEEGMSRKLIENLIGAGTYTPEFLNRFDGVIVYKPLYKEAITKIAQKLLGAIQKQARQEYNATIVFSDGFLDRLIQSAYDPHFGARNMERIIRDTVEDTISKRILEGSINGQTITF